MTEDLNTVIAAYDDAEAAGGARLSDWIGRYPQFEADLTRYAVYHYVVAHGQPVSDEAEAASRFQEVARGVREQRMAPSRGFKSLIDAAKKQGLSAPQLAQVIGLTPLEIVKLNQRLFRAATIPKVLAARLAEAIGSTMEDVRAYLRQPPTLAQGAAYKSGEAPKVAAQVDFAASIAESRSLDPDSKLFWAEAARDPLGEE